MITPRGNFDIICIQETKREKLDDAMIRILQEHQSFDWMAKPPVGLFGGVLLSWKSGLFDVKRCFGGSRFVLHVAKLVILVNVYAPGLTTGKREMQEAIVALKHHTTRKMCFFDGKNLPKMHQIYRKSDICSGFFCR